MRSPPSSSARALLLVMLVAMVDAHASVEGGTTTLASGDDSLLQHLRAYHWRLIDARDAQGGRITTILDIPGEPPQLDFSGVSGLTDAMRREAEADGYDAADILVYPGGQAPGGGDAVWSVRHLCNGIGGELTLRGDRIRFHHAPTTLRGCGEHVARRDRDLARLFVEVVVSIEQGGQPRLSQTSSLGDRLEFSGHPTAATRYGSEGELLVLGIAPRRVACSHLQLPGHGCLEVRELSDDMSSWRQPDARPWTVLQQDIEGFTHVEGQCHVIQVRRFDLVRPAGGVTQAWVLERALASSAEEYCHFPRAATPPHVSPQASPPHPR